MVTQSPAIARKQARKRKPKSSAAAPAAAEASDAASQQQPATKRRKRASEKCDVCGDVCSGAKTCPACSKAFRDHSSLRRHLQTNCTCPQAQIRVLPAQLIASAAAQPIEEEEREEAAAKEEEEEREEEEEMEQEQVTAECEPDAKSEAVVSSKPLTNHALPAANADVSAHSVLTRNRAAASGGTLALSARTSVDAPVWVCGECDKSWYQKSQRDNHCAKRKHKLPTIEGTASASDVSSSIARHT